MKKIDGIVVALIGILYGLGGLGVEESKVGIQDRVGPWFFPFVIAVLLLMCGIVMIIRKDAVDHRVVWPSQNFWKPFFVLIGVLVTYGIVFDSIGFFVANTLLCTYVGVLLKARLLPSLLSGSIIGLSIFIIFSLLLEINLPYGVLEFLEEWVMDGGY